MAQPEAASTEAAKPEQANAPVPQETAAPAAKVAKLGSTAVKTDAWHHRADVFTSAGAFIGVSIAIIGGNCMTICGMRTSI